MAVRPVRAYVVRLADLAQFIFDRPADAGSPMRAPSEVRDGVRCGRVEAARAALVQRPGSGPPVSGRQSSLEARAILFDLDGVLVDSVDCIRRIWQAWAEPRGLDIEEVLRVSHGRRTAEALALLAPDADVAAESARLDAAETTLTEGVRPVDGAADLLAALPAGTWAIVTSGLRQVAELRMRCTGLPVPEVLVVAEDVANGKPDPEAFLLGAQRLGVPPEDCVVVEDSPAGIEAARAAGMRVVGVASTHRPSDLAAADVVVADLAAISADAIRAERHGRAIVRVRFARPG